MATSAGGGPRLLRQAPDGANVQRGIERVLVADHPTGRGCDRGGGDKAGSAPAGGAVAGDGLAPDRREAVAEHPSAPLLRTLRMLAHEEPRHPCQHRRRLREVSRAARFPGRAGQLPDVVVARVYLDPGIVRGHEAVVDLLGERDRVEGVALPGVVGNGWPDPVEVAERRQARGGRPEVADRVVPVGDRLEDVVAVMARVGAVAADPAGVPPTALVVALGVLDQRAVLVGREQRSQHPVDRRAAGLRVVGEQSAVGVQHDPPGPGASGAA